jgi:phosphatidylethanolamine/phosphatidyl-N-methylethanolamine N-methyltransferase
MPNSPSTGPNAARGAATSLERDELPETFAAADAAPAASRDRLEFLKGFLRNPGRVGSVIPSSHWLEQRVVRGARIADARTVVELGPGTGGTTRALLRAMNPQARLLAIELDPDFHAHIARTQRDPRMFLEQGSAEHIAEYLAARRLPAPDAVVSGIPFSAFPAELGTRIARAVADALAPGGRFVAYQLTPWVANYTTPVLGKPRMQWEFVNIPPMRVYTWVKPAA